MADRLARLNALATGGSAGLAAFDDAQKAVAGNNQSAIDSALGYGGVNIGADQANAVKALIGKYTGAYTKDAAAARTNAGAQVGYDATALDSFLAKQQKTLDQKRREAEQNMDLDSSRFEASMAAMQRATDRYSAQSASGGGSTLSGLTQTEVDDKVKGLATQALQRAMAEQEAVKDKAELTANVNENAGLFKKGGAFFAANPGEASKPASSGPFTIRGAQGQGPVVTAEMQAQAQAASRNAIIEQADRDRLAAIQQQAYDNLMFNQFQQEAAIGLGMDPDIAMGRYAVDAESLLERQKMLTEAQFYDPQLEAAEMEQDNLDRELQLKLKELGISYQKVKNSANSFNMTPDEAIGFVAGDKAKSVKDLAVDAMGAGPTAEEQFAEFAANIDAAEDLSPEEKAFWKQYYESSFYASPTVNQYDNASFGPGAAG